LAERLLVNPNTIAKAYSELARERVIDSQQGRGVFVAPLRQRYNKAERARRLTPVLDAFVHEGVALGYDAEEMIDALRQRLAKLRIGDLAKTERASV
jgi:GntR family transcriptional regulator